MNPLLELKRLGQSVWHDNLRKGIVTSGELKRLSDEYAVSGITSNPTIFERAIAGTSEYDEDISKLLKDGLGDEEISRKLIIRDVRLAADTFAGLWRETRGMEGLVSIEADPRLARDAASTMDEARGLFQAVDRPNIMVKVPGTAEGLKAIEELTFEGRCVNVTLLFSVYRYEEVAWAHIRGLERRAAAGMPIDTAVSVASFFVSRIDTLFDRILEERIERAKSNDERARLRGLLGKVAVANARQALMKYEGIYSSDRFRKLKDSGAKPQRLLWASTGTKNPQYSDIKYITELVYPGTINTMPLHTLLAFYDHGKAAAALTEDMGGAKKVFEGLDVLGIDYKAVTERLEAEGIKSFIESYEGILRTIAEKRETLEKKAGLVVKFAVNGFESAISEALDEVSGENFFERLWAKDPTLWKTGLEEKRQIKGSLGWMALPYVMDEHIEEITDFAREVKAAGFKDIVLLGMGGSSLAPLVFATTFGKATGYPGLIVLDSTDPDALKAVEDRIDLERTLFIVSSKSGSTIEPLSLFEYFHEELGRIKGAESGRNFIAITDPGTPLEGFSKKYRFRKLFINPKDVGGRFSALSYFGLVPAALTGIDIGRLLEHASRVEAMLQPCVSVSENPVLMLGAALGKLGLKGRDKLTFFISKEIESFGMWIEQLIAESTGKEGKGLVPIAGEPLGAPGSYGNDRVFISITLGREDKALADALHALAMAGHPVIELRLRDIYELGGEFLRWEVATAVAGQILGINPFDQPDVELAKKLAVSRLGQIGAEEGLKPPGVAMEGNGFSVYLGRTAFGRMSLKDHGPAEGIREFLKLIGKGDYVGVMAYYDPSDPALAKRFSEMRKLLRDSTGVPTQFGYGPRYLHSTGQLHKGRPDCGVFIIFCHQAREDFKVPGSRFSFSQLELSQAYGDMEALDSKGSRVALVVMKDPSIEALKEFEGAALS
ncbi:MAG: transaldolase [Deltaproteobacteria bacterium GWA2_54_12]|nr:MAG: transaldolase [Deltaproteobacteria bacterium GWA2_54_12]